MKTTRDQQEAYREGQVPLPQDSPSRGAMPLPATRSRLGWRIAIGVLIEALTLIAVMVTLATNQFGVVSYVLGVIGILIPLAFLTWSFWYLTRDEARWREEVREKIPAPARKP